MRLIEWIKRNKLASFLLLIIGVYFLRLFLGLFLRVNTLSLTMPRESTDYSESSQDFGLAPSKLGTGRSLYSPNYYPPEAEYPPTDIKDRMVIEDSDLSLLVKDVVSSRKKIITYAQSSGGYMVSTNVSNPQDAPTANIVIRVPSSRLEEALDYLKSLALKVVSENLNGQDVTDQFVDVEARIALLEKTKQKFDSILAQASEISDITNLNREIINIQAQIDSLRGQQDALRKRSKLAKVTIYLSTDEIALPYAPSETFRPEVIFKLAVRSLVGNLRKIATVVIWVAVYAVFWVPLLILVTYLRKRLKKS